MSDFNKYSNYTEESSFSSVVFGSNRPLLEVELNEVQQIIDSKFTKIMKALGVEILFLSDPTYSDGVLTIDSALVFEEDGGYIFEVREASVECGEDDEIYLQIEEKVVDSSTELHSYGNSTSDIIANHIKDERYPTETTKRKCVTYTLMADSEVPNSTDTIKYIGVAKVEGEDIIYTDSSNTESLLAQAKSNFTKLQGDIDTRLKHYDYIDIMDKITVNTENCILKQAFVKNGNVHIIGEALKQSTSQSYNLFTINEAKYRPFYSPLAVVGSFYITTDPPKVTNITITPEHGGCTMWISDALGERVYFNFVYPLR